MAKRAPIDDLPAHRKFGYEHAVFMQDMHERLCEARGLDPKLFHAQVYLDAGWAYSELGRFKPSYRQRQEAARERGEKWVSPAPQEAAPALTLEELAYLADKLQMVNDPLGQQVLDKLARIMDRGA